jgi:hypothetical protein
MPKQEKRGNHMVKISPVLRLNMSGIGQGPDRALEADRYRAAIDMAEYADSHGFAIVNVEEHHDVDLGWIAAALVEKARPWTARHDTRLALIREGLAAIEKLGSRPI